MQPDHALPGASAGARARAVGKRRGILGVIGLAPGAFDATPRRQVGNGAAGGNPAMKSGKVEP